MFGVYYYHSFGDQKAARIAALSRDACRPCAALWVPLRWVRACHSGGTRKQRTRISGAPPPKERKTRLRSAIERSQHARAPPTRGRPATRAGMDGGGFFPDPDDYEPAAPMLQHRGVPTAARGVPPPMSDDGYDEEGEAALEAMLMQEQQGGASSSSASYGAAAAAAGEDDGDGADTAAPVLGKCVDCKEKLGQDKFFEAFTLSVCFDCQRAGKGQGGKYQVITKSKAKDEYLLTDRHLAKERGGLGCMTVPNPRDNRYGDMRLYLRAQVEQLALQLWGSDEALFDEKERRVQERLQKAEQKKRKASKPGHGGDRNQAAAKRQAAQAAKHRAHVASVAHTHSFSPDEVYDEESDTWTKTCTECGFEVQYERL